jgi:hypothetical protein
MGASTRRLLGALTEGREAASSKPLTTASTPASERCCVGVQAAARARGRPHRGPSLQPAIASATPRSRWSPASHECLATNAAARPLQVTCLVSPSSSDVVPPREMTGPGAEQRPCRCRRRCRRLLLSDTIGHGCLDEGRDDRARVARTTDARLNRSCRRGDRFPPRTTSDRRRARDRKPGEAVGPAAPGLTTAAGRKHERRTTRGGRDPDARFSAKRSRARDSAGRGGDLGAGGVGFGACFHANTEGRRQPGLKQKRKPVDRRRVRRRLRRSGSASSRRAEVSVPGSRATRGLHAPRPDARETRGAGLGTPGRRRRAPGDVGVSQRSCLQSRNSQPSIGHSESVASGARVGGQADELAALFPEPLCEFGVPGLGAGSHYLLVFDVLAGESSGVVGEREPDQRAGAALRGA